LTGKDTRRINVLGALASPALLAVNRGLGFPDEGGSTQKLQSLYRKSRDPCLLVLSRVLKREAVARVSPSLRGSLLALPAALRTGGPPLILSALFPSLKMAHSLLRGPENCRRFGSGAIPSRRYSCFSSASKLVLDRMVASSRLAYRRRCLLSGPDLPC